jgi:SAM-dependent methyltransferase
MVAPVCRLEVPSLRSAGVSKAARLSNRPMRRSMRSGFSWLAARVLAEPAVYEGIQRLSGSRIVDGRIREACQSRPRPALVLDVGGGTGASAALWDPETRYVCLDVERVKVARLRQRSDALALVGDALRLPVASSSVDALLCRLVAHHIDSASLPILFAEMARVLQSGGYLIFVDALDLPDRWQSRLLWKYDRGRCPRSEDELRASLETWFEVVEWQRFTVYHEYALCLAVPRNDRARPPTPAWSPKSLGPYQ